MLNDEEARSMTTGKLRQQCERLANNDDETLELIRRGYRLKWTRAFQGSRRSLYLDGVPTHGPDARV